MPSTAAVRLLLFADTPRPAVPDLGAKVRRYRLARLPLEATPTGADEPRYAHLKRSYD